MHNRRQLGYASKRSPHVFTKLYDHSTEEIILLFIHGVLQRLCLLSLCFIASFNFRALLTKQNTKKIRKKDHRRMMRDQQARPVPIVCLWCMHAFGDWELQFVLNPGCHLSQTFSLWVVCVCIFSFFFRYFVYLTVRKLLCGIVYEATRGSTGACLMIFFFLFRMLILLLVIIIVVCSTTTQKKLFFVVLFSPTNTHTRRGWPFGGRYFYISILLMSFSVLPDETNEIYIIYHHTQYIRKIIQYINIESQS